MMSTAWLATITAAVAAFALRRARWAIDGPA
jgi:hypothetical protein